MRVGFGYDSHRMVEGRKLILGGVEIPHEKGLYGHSDADVLIHAICDALIGALGCGDIGKHFPDTDAMYRGISSMKLLRNLVVLMEEKGFRLNNIDSTIVIERPRLQEYTSKMAYNIAHVFDVSPEQVNVKAKTNEGMGFVGRSEGVVAFAVVSVEEWRR